MNLLIKFVRPDSMKQGNATLSGRYYTESISVFPELANEEIKTPARGIGVYAKKPEGSKPAYLLNITSIKQVDHGIKIFYTVSDILDSSSEQLLELATRRLIGDGRIKKYERLPLWSVLDDLQTESLLNPTANPGYKGALSLKDKLAFLKEQGQWFKMVDPFKPVSNLKESHPKVWNDPPMLRDIAYAARKLAETDQLPLDARYDLFLRNAYLNEKRMIREDVEILLKRCIELDPEHPEYYSDLGSFHYRNVMELTEKRGRNDQDPFAELDKAVHYYDLAIEKNRNRIHDLFDKGYLLTVKYPELVRSRIGRSDLEKEKRTRIKDGIDSLLKLRDLWQGYKDYSPDQRELKEQYANMYIQCLYCLGLAYEELVEYQWDVADYYLGLCFMKDMSPENDDMENAENSLKYFVECWNAECDTGCLPDVKLSECVLSTWTVDGIDKLQHLGLINLKLNGIYSDLGLQNEAHASLSDAEQFLTEALKTDPPPNDVLKPKNSIADLLAKVHITKGQFDQAQVVIKKYCNSRRLKNFILNTYALTLIRMKQYQEAEKMLERASLDLSNKYAAKACFLLGMVYTEQDKQPDAVNLFKKAIRHGYKDQTDVRDLFYIGLAMIEEKAGNKRNAKVYYKKVSDTGRYKKYAIYKMNRL